MQHSFAPPSILPDISPTRGEIELSSALLLIVSVAEEKPILADGVISPLVGEMSGRTEGGDVGRRRSSCKVAS
ncbi:MAG: hypothetical protein BGN87_02080 [Rhizobiales bacterium 65-79]|jgi:precorrin-3B synthase|nr:MAG: hypothetical protein BGN87_02080 [Rhizobiales bacterium 65-79]